jgi:O-antigen/teichoic acid export membrane protein
LASGLDATILANISNKIFLLREKTRSIMKTELASRFSKVLSVDAIVKASNVFLLPLYLKVMTKSEFGTYSYLVSIVGAYATMLNFGLFVSQGKMFHDFPPERKGTLLFTINVLMIGSLTGALGIIVVTGFDIRFSGFLFRNNPIDYHAYRWFFLAAVTSSIYSTMVTTHFFNSIQIRTIQKFNLSRLIIVAPLILATLFLIPGDKALLRFKALTIFEGLLILTFSIPYVRMMRTHFDANMARTALKIGLPTTLTSVIGVAYGFSDKFIMEKFYPLSEMATLNLCVTISSVIMLTFSSFQGVWVPMFFKEKVRQTAFAKVVKASKVVALVFTAMAVAEWVTFWLCLKIGVIKHDYWSVLPVLPIMLAGTVFQCLQHMFANFVVYFEQTYIGTLVVVTMAGLAIGLNILLIPHISFFGAAISGLTTSFVSFLAYFWYARIRCRTPSKARKSFIS